MQEVNSNTIEQFTLSQFKGLPDILSEDNIDEFETTLYSIDKLCADNQSAYRLIMPFHKLTFGWQLAYAHGFTWEDINMFVSLDDNEVIADNVIAWRSISSIGSYLDVDSDIRTYKNK